MPLRSKPEVELGGRMSDGTPRRRFEDPRQPVYGIEEATRYHDIHLPKCHECLRRWQFPREVSFLAGIPEDMRMGRSLTFFEPVTKECLVAYQTWDRQTQKPHLREDIFARLKLTHTIKRTTFAKKLMGHGKLQFHRLVQEFDYNRKTGDVTHCSEFFDADQEEDFRYARLVTLNSWYITLLFNMLHIIVDVFNIATGAMMIAQLFSSYGGFQHSDYVRATRIWFTVWYAVVVFLALILSAQAAFWEWKAYSSPAVGDLIVKCHPIDRTLTFLAMTIFIFFGVDKLVKDIVVILHPWKSVQPYAAIKLEGTRVYVVGYKSSPLFNVENASGQFRVLMMHALHKLISFIYKVSVVVAITVKRKQCAPSSPDGSMAPSPPPGCGPDDHSDDDTWTQLSSQGTLLMSSVAAGFACLLVVNKIVNLVKHRRLCKEELVRILEFADKNRDAAKQGPALKLLALHFHQEYKDGQLRKVTPAKFKHGTDGKCSTCGRVKDPAVMVSAYSEKEVRNALSNPKAQLLW